MRYFERLPEESAKAYAAFAVYRDLGPQRSLAKCAETYYGSSKNLAQIGLWSRKHAWVDRARAYDDFLELERRSAIAAYEREHGVELARRQQQLAEELLAVKEALVLKLKTMVSWPLEQTVVEREVQDEQGNVIHQEVHTHPARWDFNTLNRAISILDEKPQQIDVRNFDFGALTDEVLDEILAGVDPWEVLLRRTRRGDQWGSP